MPFLRATLHVLRTVTVAALVLLAILAAAVQIQQRLLRHHAEQLLADMQSIRLHQTTWAEAQTLMNRWGRYGHYDGTCTASDCTYGIMLEDEGSRFLNATYYEGSWTWQHPIVILYELFGGRQVRIHAHLVVQDGTIRQITSAFVIEGATDHYDGMSSNPSLILTTQNRSTLLKEIGGSFSGATAIEEHPNFIVRQPDGCEGCEARWLIYTPELPLSELRRLTSFDLSCITRWRGCAHLTNLVPDIHAWHLEDAVEHSYPNPPPCRTAIQALSRDAETIIVVDVLNSSGKPRGNPHWYRAEAKVKIVTTLKGKAPWQQGNVSTSYGASDSPENPPEALIAGKRYILLVEDDEQTDPLSIGFGAFPRCGVLPDTFEVRQQVALGIAQNETLRHPEPDRVQWWW